MESFDSLKKEATKLERSLEDKVSRYQQVSEFPAVISCLHLTACTLQRIARVCVVLNDRIPCNIISAMPRFLLTIHIRYIACAVHPWVFHEWPFLGRSRTPVKGGWSNLASWHPEDVDYPTGLNYYEASASKWTRWISECVSACKAISRDSFRSIRWFWEIATSSRAEEGKSPAYGRSQRSWIGPSRSVNGTPAPRKKSYQ